MDVCKGQPHHRLCFSCVKVWCLNFEISLVDEQPTRINVGTTYPTPEQAIARRQEKHHRSTLLIRHFRRNIRLRPLNTALYSPSQFRNIHTTENNQQLQEISSNKARASILILLYPEHQLI